jgi:hypothetical protein
MFLKLLLYWGYIVTFTEVLTICLSLIHPLNRSPLSLLPHFWNSFSRSHFFIFLCDTSYFHCIHPLHPFICSPPTPLVPTLQVGPVSLSCSPFLKKKKNPTMYVLYPELVHPLYFFSFYLRPLLMVISTRLKIPYSSLYRKYISHIHLLKFLVLPCLSPICDLPLVWPIFHIICVCIGTTFHIWEKTCGLWLSEPG